MDLWSLLSAGSLFLGTGTVHNVLVIVDVKMKTLQSSLAKTCWAF